MTDIYEDIVRQWYNKVRPLFVNTLRKRFSQLDYDTIENLYQDAFLAVYENLQAERVRDDTSWSSYIIQIGINLATKELRHSGITDSIYESDSDNEEGRMKISRTVEQFLSEGFGDDEPLYKNENALSLLGYELNHTPEPCNTILRLYYYEDLSMDNIAIALNFKNATTAKTKKSKCMTDLIDRVDCSFKKADFDVSPKKRNPNGKSRII